VSQPQVRASLFYRACQALCRVVTSLLFDLKVFGAEHVPLEGGVLLLSNHQSNLDPVLVAVRLGRPVTFLAKAQLFKPWGLRWLIRQLNAYPIKQGAGDIGAVRETIARLKAGHLLTVFPEGHRTEDGELLPLQSGFALVVRKVDVPIIPVAVHGSFRAWPKGQRMVRPTPIRVKYGPPIDVQGLSSQEIVARAEQAIRTLFDELRGRDDRTWAAPSGPLIEN
jgi:1-acyl-sn-glycerol-3-phosphate acyltransferase